jgi:cell division protein FtsX
VYGIVLYTGNETKIHMSDSEPIYKTSHLMDSTNEYIFRIFLLQLLIATICAFIGTSEHMTTDLNSVYLGFEDKSKDQSYWLVVI